MKILLYENKNIRDFSRCSALNAYNCCSSINLQSVVIRRFFVLFSAVNIRALACNEVYSKNFFH